jgi:hypothetical protein
VSSGSRRCGGSIPLTSSVGVWADLFTVPDEAGRYRSRYRDLGYFFLQRGQIRDECIHVHGGTGGAGAVGKEPPPAHLASLPSQGHADLSNPGDRPMSDASAGFFAVVRKSQRSPRNCLTAGTRRCAENSSLQPAARPVFAGVRARFCRDRPGIVRAFSLVIVASWQARLSVVALMAAPSRRPGAWPSDWRAIQSAQTARLRDGFNGPEVEQWRPGCHFERGDVGSNMGHARPDPSLTVAATGGVLVATTPRRVTALRDSSSCRFDRTDTGRRPRRFAVMPRLVSSARGRDRRLRAPQGHVAKRDRQRQLHPASGGGNGIRP